MTMVASAFALDLVELSTGVTMGPGIRVSRAEDQAIHTFINLQLAHEKI